MLFRTGEPTNWKHDCGVCVFTATVRARVWRQLCCIKWGQCFYWKECSAGLFIVPELWRVLARSWLIYVTHFLLLGPGPIRGRQEVVADWRGCRSVVSVDSSHDVCVLADVQLVYHVFKYILCLFVKCRFVFVLNQRSLPRMAPNIQTLKVESMSWLWHAGDYKRSCRTLSWPNRKWVSQQNTSANTENVVELRQEVWTGHLDKKVERMKLVAATFTVIPTYCLKWCCQPLKRSEKRFHSLASCPPLSSVLRIIYLIHPNEKCFSAAAMTRGRAERRRRKREAELHFKQFILDTHTCTHTHTFALLYSPLWSSTI